MQFSTALVLAAMASLASAQNPFTFTNLASITAGTPFNITWAPSTGTSDTVSLVLRQGPSNALDTVETIAAKIQNTGSYLWTPSPSLTNGPNYAFQIIDDGNTAIVNYSNQFSISSTNTVTSARSSTASRSSSSATSSGTNVVSVSSTRSSTATGSGSGSTGASSTTGSARTSSSSRAATTSTGGGAQTPSASPTGIVNGVGSVEVGGGLMALVVAIMVFL
ncbi:uncharacterized protein RCO7_04687 [Rhynchosporium graminicola]|uniref:Yeast cell wall synthesis Kre9/Knh1-like N-terminal domain-containing protein n=1 Tax=Rhynchosporium graminicola TaxID=2792576 RepID=A0A1E1JTE9_9HELO|nr:uncharacterized protein RCO7_04687 [Rhynchosporium commune]